MAKEKRVMPAKNPPERGYYSNVVMAKGNLLFVAGQVPIDSQGRLVGKGDIAAQTRQVHNNIKGQLEACGAQVADIVKLTTFTTNIKEFRDKTTELRRDFFGPHQPASTLVGVVGLADPDFMVEIEAVAVTD